MEDIDTLLARVNDEDVKAREALFQRIYPELGKLAAQALAPHRRGATLDTGSLVNETCLRLLGAGKAPGSLLHLRAVAATAMRQIIVDHARRHLAGKRGGGAVHTTLGAIDAEGLAAMRVLEPADILELEQALQRLSALGPRAVQVVECRFFAGMHEQETADALGLSRSTVQREWRKAQAWLQVLRQD